MANQPRSLTELVDLELSGFRVQAMIEVYSVDTDGVKSKSLAFFHDETIAKAFVQNHVDSAYYRCGHEFVLTNGEIGFLIGRGVELLDDEAHALVLRKKALEKLTPDERRILGL